MYLKLCFPTVDTWCAHFGPEEFQVESGKLKMTLLHVHRCCYHYVLYRSIEIIYGVPNDGRDDFFNAHHIMGNIALVDRCRGVRVPTM